MAGSGTDAAGGGRADDGTGGISGGSGGGGQPPERDSLGGLIDTQLVNVSPGDTVPIEVQIKRGGAFKGSVLVSFDGKQFSATPTLAIASKSNVILSIEASPNLEQGYYEGTILLESTDGDLNHELPVNIRVRGAPGAADQTFGDPEAPWVGLGNQVEAAVDDTGSIYLRTERTLFRFDERGIPIESFTPEGLDGTLGPMIGMKEGVLLGAGAPAAPRVIHIHQSGQKNPDWSGTLPPDLILTSAPWSLTRRAGRIVVAGTYQYPSGRGQVFSYDGTLDRVFEAGVRTVHAMTLGFPFTVRLDSETRIITAVSPPEGYNEPIRRLLPDGHIDATFGANGELPLVGTKPFVVDFDVLSDDTLAILTADGSQCSLALGTPTEVTSPGVLRYRAAPAGYNQSLLLLATSDARFLVLRGPNSPSPDYWVYLYSNDGQPITSFGQNGSLKLTDYVNAYYAASPPSKLKAATPVFDRKANRLIVVWTTESGRVHLHSIWL